MTRHGVTRACNVGVLALPLTIITGLFGMNVAGVPFAERSAGFWIVLFLVVGVVSAGATVAWTFRDRA